jgi:hypothetical protein
MKASKLAPIVVFTYNRLLCTVETIEHLKKNLLAKDSDLFIYSDAPKNIKDIKKVQEVRDYIHNIHGFKSVNIILREKNFGLRRSIIDGVTNITNKYGKVIVLEDDLITSPFFLNFINDGLTIYEDDEEVCQVMGYSYTEKYMEKYEISDTYFIKNISSLGWGVWARSWKVFISDTKSLLHEIQSQNLSFELNREESYDYVGLIKNQIEGKVDSWAINWLVSTFLNNMYTLYPSKSFVRHIGISGTGTHYSRNFKRDDPLHVALTNKKIEITRQKVIELEGPRRAYNEFLKSYKMPLFIRIINRLNKYTVMLFSKKKYNED